MNRRDLIRSLASLASIAGFRLPLASAGDYRGKLFVFVQADGGWDPTSFCDPKTNPPGEPVINRWAQSDEIRQAGNIRYAPFGKNEAFFTKYHRRMLVINGVDAQTNSHSAGIVHNWSGRISEGYPTTSALLAAQYGLGLSMPYLSFGGFSNTAGVATFTRLDNPGQIRTIATPEANPPWEPYLIQSDWEDLQLFRAATLDRLAAAPNLLPRSARNRRLYASALTKDATEGLRAYAAMIPDRDQLQEREGYDRYYSLLKRQAQLAVLAFKAGVAVSADLYLGGFDTHANHDPDHNWLLGNLTDSVDFLWDYAETHGVADRMIVVMGSDFGRTNKYNSNEGKDHWPIGSFIVMEKNQGWTNRVIGETDELHFASRVNPSTLKRDDSNGTLIHPRHVHKALRRYLRIETSAESRKFPFQNTQDLRLFG